MDSSVELALSLGGALAFGVVIGWVTYGTLRRAKRGSLTDITTIFGALAGAAVTALFPTEGGAFGVYSIGLALGFFGYLRAAKNPNAPNWLGEQRENPGGYPRSRELPEGVDTRDR